MPGLPAGDSLGQTGLVPTADSVPGLGVRGRGGASTTAHLERLVSESATTQLVGSCFVSGFVGLQVVE